MMRKQSHADIIKEVCKKITDLDVDVAKEILNKKYPHEELKNAGRQYNEFIKTKIFRRDGFIDQYSGEKLIYPPVLKILSVLMKKEFPNILLIKHLIEKIILSIDHQ